MESTTRLRAKRPGGYRVDGVNKTTTTTARGHSLLANWWDIRTSLSTVLRRRAGGRAGGRRVYRIYTAAVAAMEGMLFNRSYTASRLRAAECRVPPQLLTAGTAYYYKLF